MRYLYLLFFVLLSAQASAVGVKIYVGSSYNSTHMNNHYFMELILCNNTVDTLFIRRDDVDNLYPAVTNDASEVSDEGSKVLLTNIDKLEDPDQAGVFDISPDGTEKDQLDMVTKQAAGKEKNQALKQRKINNQMYYVILPQKCITVNSFAQIGRHELSKLRSLSAAEKEKSKAYFVVPVFLMYSSDYIQHRKNLVSRKSEALKKCLFYESNKKEEK